MGWYITILQEMREQLGLKGNELIVFAFINGYSQGGHGCYHGSLATLQGVCGIASRQTATDVLKSLVEKGYIYKSETIKNGVKYVSYAVCPNIGQGVQKMDKGCLKNGHNIEDININNTLSINSRAKFQKPSLDEIRVYCQERGNQVDPEKFFNFYESKGWVVGKSPMKDWKAAVRTWEQRRLKTTRATYQPRQRKSVFEQNLEVMDQMFGTDMHSQTYGKKEVYDEQ